LPNVIWYSREDAAERVRVEPSYLARLVDLGILVPEGSDRFSPGDVRRNGAPAAGRLRLTIDARSPWSLLS
jgi:hypothetical protein